MISQDEKINSIAIDELAVCAHDYASITRDCDTFLAKTINMFLSINKCLSKYDYFLIRIIRNS